MKFLPKKTGQIWANMQTIGLPLGPAPNSFLKRFETVFGRQIQTVPGRLASIPFRKARPHLGAFTPCVRSFLYCGVVFFWVLLAGFQ
jgi:hypothetical protein